MGEDGGDLLNGSVQSLFTELSGQKKLIVGKNWVEHLAPIAWFSTCQVG
jgi:hypothetical protein